jgi:N-acetylgalactosamine-N,N'-diacetylbacillosaminyl-diphospho-undecaprenol 4-alpha-N-acetylgalactosaminyltransferase
MIFPNKNYKIAFNYRLSAGGSKVMANLSVYFESKSIEVHNIIVINEVSFPMQISEFRFVGKRRQWTY